MEDDELQSKPSVLPPTCGSTFVRMMCHTDKPVFYFQLTAHSLSTLKTSFLPQRSVIFGNKQY